MLFNALLAVAASTAVVSASPLKPRAQSAVLPLTHVNKVTSASGLVAKGQSKISKINGDNKSEGNRLATSSGTVENDDVSYVAPVVIGGYTYSLIVDTGCESTTAL
jgi:hypothetical protein